MKAYLIHLIKCKAKRKKVHKSEQVCMCVRSCVRVRKNERKSKSGQETERYEERDEKQNSHRITQKKNM